MKKIILALTMTLSLTAFAQTEPAVQPGTAPADKSEGPGAIHKSEPAVMPSEKHKTHKVSKKSHKKSHHRKAHKKATK
jgi:hypothetical protein